MSKENTDTVCLKVLEAYTRDVGRGVARVDHDSMDTLNVSTGDVIEIKGKRRTVAKCLPLFPPDEGKGTIRIDGISRNNSGIAIGDTITVRKIKAVAAEKVVVAPLEAIPPIDEHYLADALESVPLIKGDNIMVRYFDGRLTFQVIGVTPAADVVVTQKTVFYIAEKVEALRGVPLVTYEDIGGLNDEIRKVREMIELPLRHPEIFEKLGIRKPNRVILIGPEGCGKTLLIRSVSQETTIPLQIISGSEISSKVITDFNVISKICKDIKERAPCIWLIDEIENFIPNDEMLSDTRRYIKSDFISNLSNLVNEPIFVVGLSSKEEMLDYDILKNMGFRIIQVNLPDSSGRKDILSIHSRNMSLSDDVSIQKIAEATGGYTGRELELLCEIACKFTIRRLLPELHIEEEKLPPETLDKLIVNNDDFQKAINEIDKLFKDGRKNATN